MSSSKTWTHSNLLWLLPLFWLLLIYCCSALSSLPALHVSLFDFLVKKLAHMALFAGLFWSFWLPCHHAPGHLASRSRYFWLWLLLFCFFYACTDEWHQSFVPGRTATWRDVGFDTLGACLACLWSYRYL
ncbi:VanZ family protein [bacterium]|nr:VanZ family protein [bacterium]